MKAIRYYIPAVFFSFLLLLSSCELIGNIFKAGVYVGVIVVVLIIVLIIWLIRKMM